MWPTWQPWWIWLSTNSRTPILKAKSIITDTYPTPSKGRIGVCFNFVISSGMEENKKSGGGDVRAKALSWDGEWDKAWKLVFSFITTLAHSGLLRTSLTSLAARKKSRFAEKKSAPPKKNCACCFSKSRIRDFKRNSWLWERKGVVQTIALFFELQFC